MLGSGDFKYERVPVWPNLPKYWDFGATSDVDVNSSDEVHVFSRGKHPLTIWDLEGNFISSWGEGEFSNNEHGIFIDSHDCVWLVDANYHLVTKHSPDGSLLTTLGKKMIPSDTYYGHPFNMPSGLSISSKGDIYVSDGYGNKRVHKFDRFGLLDKSWGKFGTGKSEFAIVHNLTVDKFDRVFVCDRENNRVQIFNSEGEYLEEWNDLHMPGDIYIDNDVVYIVEQTEVGGVSRWTLEGEVITRWWAHKGEGKGTLISGHGICVDSQGSIYVAELSPANRVSKFQKI